jgi:N-acetylmuramic acid 6-phosphate (MurNAc-6-P) etherase
MGKGISGAGPFISAALIVAALTGATVAFFACKAANANPVRNLRCE